jgi:hypothetical protein
MFSVVSVADIKSQDIEFVKVRPFLERTRSLMTVFEEEEGIVGLFISI